MMFINLKQSTVQSIPSDEVNEAGEAVMHTLNVVSEVKVPISEIKKITFEKAYNETTKEDREILVIETNELEEYDAEDYSRHANGEIKFVDTKKDGKAVKAPLKTVVKKTRNKYYLFETPEMITYYKEVLSNL